MEMKRLAIACVMLCSCLKGTALATPLSYQAALNGLQTVPPNGSAATGVGFVTVDAATHLLSFTVSWTNLAASPLVAHIHCCAPVGSNGTLAIQFLGLAGTSGTFGANGVDLTVVAQYNPVFLNAHGGTAAGAETFLEAGLAGGIAYIDIPDSVFGGGEIRGQLAPIPEPATALLLVTGFALIAARYKASAIS